VLTTRHIKAAEFEIKKTASGKFHFNLKAGNGEVILSVCMPCSAPLAGRCARAIGMSNLR
jgi:hypothetical protein